MDPDLPTRTLIWNQLREFETRYNHHQPHQTLQQAADMIDSLVSSGSTDMLLDLDG